MFVAEPDQLQKDNAGNQCRCRDHDGYGGYEQYPGIGREIPEMAGIGVIGFHVSPVFCGMPYRG